MSAINNCASFKMHWLIWCLLLLTIIKLTIAQDGASIDLGGVITGIQRLDKSRGPYLVKDDLIIMESGELKLGPGVELKFLPKVGLTVKGILTAEVSCVATIIIISMYSNDQNMYTLSQSHT